MTPNWGHFLCKSIDFSVKVRQDIETKETVL